MRFTAESGAELLRRLARSGFDPDVIIVESFRRVFEGNENSQQDVTAFWRSVEPLSQKGKTLILSHHMRKAHADYRIPASPRDRASGSTDIMAGLETAYAVLRSGRDFVIVEGTKAREFDEPDTFVVSISESPADDALRLRYEGTRKEFDGAKKKAEQAGPLILAFLDTQPNRSAAWAAIVAHLAPKGISARTAERVRPSMREAGTLLVDGKGRWRLPTADLKAA